MGKTNEVLLHEIKKLRAEVGRLSQICQLQRTELLESAKKAHEVVTLEAEKSSKSIAAEEAIKSLIAHPKDVAEKLPSGIYDHDGSHTPQENGLESLISCASPVAPFESWATGATLESPQWVEQYEPGVYLTLIDFYDGTRDLRRVRFSRKRFQKHQAETWWLENQNKVYETYNVRVVR